MGNGLPGGLLASFAFHACLLLWIPWVPKIRDAAPVPVENASKLTARLVVAAARSESHIQADRSSVAAQPIVPRAAPSIDAIKETVGSERVAYVRAYWPSGMLERQPVPVSAPDAGMLAGESVPPGMVKMKLFIGASGSVEDVKVEGDEKDEASWLAVRRMFLATRFIPGRRAGQDVASWMEIELSVTEVVRLLE